MKQLITYFIKLSKRQLKKIPFLILLLCIPFLAVGLKKAFTIDEVKINVALYTNDSTGLSNRTINQLTSNKDIIKFVKCNSKTELKNLVASGSCQCGYILPDNLENILDSNSYRNSIDVIIGSKSVASMTNEMVFAGIFRNYAFEILDKYVNNSGLFNSLNSKEITSELSSLYSTYLSNGTTFSFSYANDDKISRDATTLIPGYLVLSVRGILSLIIFASGFGGAMILYKDRKKHIFCLLYGPWKYIVEFMVIWIPVLFIGLSCLIGNILCDSQHFLFQSLSMLLYSLAISIFCYILTYIIKNESTYGGISMLLLVCSIIICPVFINIAEFNGNFRILQYLLPPTWYLMM